MANEAGSNRLKALEKTHVLDEATRKRRQKKALEALEKDNYQDDMPTSTLYVSDFRLQFNKKFQQRFTVDEATPATSSHESNIKDENITAQNESEASAAKKRKFKSESKLRIKKNFATLLDEEYALVSDKKYNYFSIAAKPSKFPPRKFCAVCGFPSTYTCVQCGTKYCSSKCLQTHKDTRCLKWTA